MARQRETIPVHWSADLVPPELSAFQRIATGVKIQVDGPELSKHHAVILTEFEDADGGVWQTHAELGRVPEFLQSAFVLPGDYSVSVAIYDPVTRKHGFTQKKLHVASAQSRTALRRVGRSPARGVLLRRKGLA